MEVPFTRADIRDSLEREPSPPVEDMLWLANATPALKQRIRASIPEQHIPAAVLIPLIDRPSGWTVLLTQRAAALRAHAGQISFPGGRIEPEDRDAYAAALREAEEEIGLSERKVEFAGYLPDHLVATGFRITPAVGFVSPDHDLRLAADEVHDAFEVPLAFLFDAANHRPRLRSFGEFSVETTDIPFGARTIWGATAGMLMTLRRLVLERRGRSVTRASR